MDLKVLSKLGYGVYVATWKKGEQFDGQIFYILFWVTSESPTVAVGI